MTESSIYKHELFLRVAFLDVGQGDTVVVSSPQTHEAIIIDCLNANSVIRYLESEHITRLCGVIVTHLHQDHYGDVHRLLETSHKVAHMSPCEVLAFNNIHNRHLRSTLLNDGDQHSAQSSSHGRHTALQRLIEWRKRNEALYATCANERRPLPPEITLHGQVQILHPHVTDLWALESTGLNNTSVVVRVEGPQASVLLTGDIEPSGWETLAKNHPALLRSDVLKFPHHGAWVNGDVDSLLDTVQPSIVVISVGTDGINYHHPNAAVFAALAKRPHIRLLCTQATSQCGSVGRERRVLLVKEHEEAALRPTQPHLSLPSPRGCPCAGTIIVELGETVRVVQPDLSFHQQIIGRNFATPQCGVGQAASGEAVSSSPDVLESERSLHRYR